MKTPFLLVLAALVLTSACTPQDKDIATPEQRANPYNNPNGGGFNKPVPGQVKLGSFGLAAFMMEKQGEVLQLLSATNLEKTQAKGAYLVENSTSDQEDVQKMTIVADEFTLKSAQYSFTQSSAWTFMINRKTENGEKVFANLTATLNSANENIMLENVPGNPPRAASLTETDARLLVNATSATTRAVFYVATGEMVLTLDGVTEKMPYKIELNMDVNTKDFSEENLVIAKATVNLRLTRNKEFTYTTANKGEVTFRNTTCPAMIGTTVIGTGKKPPEGVFTELDYRVAPKHQSLSAPCGQRPVVDLGRVLVY